MIKIIKEGKTDFRKTCDKCGCIFEYNVEDIVDSYIKCPTCHKEYYGFEPEYLEKTLFDTGLAECEPTDYLRKTDKLQTLPNEPTYQSLNACEGCPTYEQICSPSGYIGDVPCQWCSKNPWKITCSCAPASGSTCDCNVDCEGTATYCESESPVSYDSLCESVSSAYTEDISALADSKELQITCKAEGVEYTTTLETCSEMPYTISLDTDKTYYTVNLDTANRENTPTAEKSTECLSCSCRKDALVTGRTCEAKATFVSDKAECFGKAK